MKATPCAQLASDPYQPSVAFDGAGGELLGPHLGGWRRRSRHRRRPGGRLNHRAWLP